MERRISQKATSLRRRFNCTRDRASTVLNVSHTRKSRSRRPRSNTSPVSVSTAWGDSRSRYYNFTDEPGYFRPTSPLLHRQEIEADLEAEIKHACTLLSHSIERGIPTWLSYQTGPSSKPQVLDASEEQPSLEKSEESIVQGCLSPEKKQVEAETMCRKGKHDSGVAFSFHSPGTLGRDYRNSLSGTGSSMSNNTRFYSQRHSSSSQPQQRECESMDKGRSRNQSLASDIDSRRSRPSSSVLSPYSPPQTHFQWQATQTFLGELAGEKDVERPNKESDLHAEHEVDAVLGAEGLIWLRASQEGEEDSAVDALVSPGSHSSCKASNDRVEMIQRPPPNRFYSVRRPSPTKNAPRQRFSALDDAWCSRGSGIQRYESSRRTLSTDEEAAGEFPAHADMPVQLRAAAGSGSSQTDVLKHNETVRYSLIISDGTQPRHRRKRVSQLLRKLAGFGRRKEADLRERGRGISGAVGAAG